MGWGCLWSTVLCASPVAAWRLKAPPAGNDGQIAASSRGCAGADTGGDNRTAHPTRGEKLVLVLEDEADVRQTLCEQLHLLGYLTLEAANGEQAMHMLAASSEIDILISDLMLPGGLSGVDVVNHALAHYPQLNILLISGRFTSGA